MNIAPTLIIAASLSAQAGCGLLDLATSDRPNGAQREAIGDIFNHLADIGAVIDDPEGASDARLQATFTSDAYARLVAPDEFAATAAATAREIEAAALTDAGCVEIGEGSATWDCDVPVVAAADCAANPADCCNVAGGGSESGGSYAGAATLAGARCGAIDLDARFTLEPPAGTVEVSGTAASGDAIAGSGDYTVDMELSVERLCSDRPLPAEGEMTVTAAGTMNALVNGVPRTVSFDGSVTVEFVEEAGECGIALLK